MDRIEGPPSAPRIWIDATTLQRVREGNPVGLMRVEGGLIANCFARRPDRSGLFAYDRRAGRMVAVDPAVLSAGAGSAARRLRRSGRLRDLGRRTERAIRQMLRAVIGDMLRWARSRAAAPPPHTTPGDVVLCLGETWAVHDLDVLRAWTRRDGLRLVVLLYDLTPVLFPHWFADRSLPGRFERYLELLRSDADLVVCISDATRRDFIAWSGPRGGTRGAVATLRLGDDKPAAPPAAQPAELAGLVPGRFVLAVSTIQVRKNYDLLYALWRRLRERGIPDLPVLVIAGRRGWLASDLLTLIENDKLTEGHIRICNDPDDAALAWLYANCRFTLYPSLYEGWGLPIAESLAYGKACIASETSSMPEVGQGLALHLDPLDFMAWQREIELLIADDARLAEREARIRAEFRPHSWAASGAELLALVDAVAASLPAGAHAGARRGE